MIVLLQRSMHLYLGMTYTQTKQFLQDSLLAFVLSDLLCKVDCLIIYIQRGMP